MTNVKAMKAFVEVARNGSFAAAARKLGLSTTSVSRLVHDLEDWLQTPLLRRTTRSLTLTDAGDLYLIRCEHIVSAWNNLELDAKAGTAQPRGRLHIAGAASPMRKIITPLLPEFLAKFPEVKIELHLKDAPVDLITEGIDVAIRIGDLQDSAMIARKCGEVRLKLTASPEFMVRHNMPETVDDLAGLPCLADKTARRGRGWTIGRNIHIDGPIAANDGEIIREMTLAGLGISLLPDFFVEEDIQTGRLTDLFPGDLNERIGLYTLLPVRRQITPAARAFADYIYAKKAYPLCSGGSTC
jgi:DNA-binding transcriptional LysR family regulator